MTLEEFSQSVYDANPPAGINGALLGLWYDGHGDWDRAHQHAQEDGSRNGSWVHAYLHRKEGDADNAAYWYARAGHPMPKLRLEAEWKAIAADLLAAK